MSGIVRRDGLSFSVVVPVLNEEKNINSIIEHLHTMPAANIKEIIVVDGAPECGTLKVIRYEDVIKVSSKKGRGPQMNAGAARATGDVLIFLHADTHLPDDGLTSIEAALHNPKVVGGAFSMRFDTKSLMVRAVARIHTLRARVTRILYGDQAIFLRRDYFQRIGGYDDLPLMEDVEITRRIRKRGDRIEVLPQKVTSSARRYEQDGYILCLARYLALIILFGFGALPRFLVRLYKN